MVFRESRAEITALAGPERKEEAAEVPRESW